MFKINYVKIKFQFIDFLVGISPIRQFHLVLKFFNAEFTKYRGKTHQYTPVVENISQKAISLTKNTVSSPQIGLQLLLFNQIQVQLVVRNKIEDQQWLDFSRVSLHLSNRSFIIPRLVLKLKFSILKRWLSNSNCKFQWQWDDDNRISDKLA